MATETLDQFVARICGQLSFEQAIQLSKALLEYQGFGSGAWLDGSGEMTAVKSLLGPRPILFDVGGHVGDYAAAFLTACPEGRCYVFEPSESHFRILNERLGRFANVVLVNTGLGARSEERPLYKHADISGLASLTKRRLDHFNIAMDKVEMVRLQTVDEVMAQHKIETIDLLKIDVEGHELDVLKGATLALRGNRIGFVQFEFGGCNLDTRTTLQDFYYFFQSFGFQIGLIQPAGRVQWLTQYDEFFEHYRTTNYLATSRNNAGRISAAPPR